MSDRCVYEDDKNRCLHPKNKRSKDVAKFFGSRPACILVGAPAGTTCPLIEKPSPQSGGGTVWDRLGQDDGPLDKFMEGINEPDD